MELWWYVKGQQSSCLCYLRGKVESSQQQGGNGAQKQTPTIPKLTIKALSSSYQPPSISTLLSLLASLGCCQQIRVNQRVLAEHFALAAAVASDGWAAFPRLLHTVPAVGPGAGSQQGQMKEDMPGFQAATAAIKLPGRGQTEAEISG